MCIRDRYHAIHNFCTVDLSAMYLDVIKDRLYTEKTDAPVRRSAQTAMYIILDTLVKIVAPVPVSYTHLPRPCQIRRTFPMTISLSPRRWAMPSNC